MPPGLERSGHVRWRWYEQPPTEQRQQCSLAQQHGWLSNFILRQSSYLSKISQIIFVEKNLSYEEILDFCKEFEQFMAFHQNLCRFYSKFVGEKMTNMRSGFPPVTVSITIYVFPIMVVTNHLCHNHLLFMEYGHNYLLSSSLQNCPHIAISKTFFKGVNLPRRCSSLQTSHNQVVAKYFVKYVYWIIWQIFDAFEQLSIKANWQHTWWCGGALATKISKHL